MAEKTKRDELLGALVGLSRAIVNEAPGENSYGILLEGLKSLADNLNDEALTEKINIVRAEKQTLTPGCSVCQFPCGRMEEYDMDEFYSSSDNIKSLKTLLLYAIIELSQKLYTKRENLTDNEKTAFSEGLFFIGEYVSPEQLLPTLEKLGKACGDAL